MEPGAQAPDRPTRRTDRIIVGVVGLLMLAAIVVPAVRRSSEADATIIRVRTLPVRADAFVDEARPGRNFGEGGRLRSNLAPRRLTLLRFAVPTFDGWLEQGVLRVLAKRGTGPVAVRVSRHDDWSEQEVHWQNRPHSTVARAAQVLGWRDRWLLVDITQQLRKRGSDGELTLILVSDRRDGIVFASRESGTGARVRTRVKHPKTTSPPGGVTVSPVADAFVSAAFPEANHGTDAVLETDRDPTLVRSYLLFDMSGVDAPVTRATLWLYAESNGSFGYRVEPVSADGWDENAITFASAPSFGAAIGSSGGVRKGTWSKVDVTTLIKTGGLMSIAIDTPGSTMIRYASRESGSSAPRLVLETGAPSQTPSPSPPPSSSSSPSPTQPPTDIQPDFPIRASFYYPWFPEAWNQSGVDPFTHYHPSLGFYDGSSKATLDAQIDAMRYAKIQAGIASWWGQGTRTDQRLPQLLQAADGTPFRWSIYYEPEAQGDPTVARISDDLSYLSDHYGHDPSFLRHDGRFVVFVYADGGDACGMVNRWEQANAVNAFLVLKVFTGYKTCATQPDSWHQYAPAKAADAQAPFSYTISPGFWHALETQPRLARDLSTWRQNVRDLVASSADWKLVTTFNEWGEGTAVESADEWASGSGYGAYLDALHDDGQASGGDGGGGSGGGGGGGSGSSGDPVIAAAGDIACSPTDGNFHGGAGSTSSCRMLATSDILVNNTLAGVLTLGDNQYESGRLSDFLSSYDPSWGRVKPLTHPAVGNHEYLTSGATGYFAYFGSAAGDPSRGFYSFDIGSWHLVSLNSNCSEVGGCGVGSPQYTWLQNDLAASSAPCTLAYWHHPRFSSGEHGGTTQVQPFWQLLQTDGAELVLNGHDHDYERFVPQSPTGSADPNGIREFVVGTGGKSHYGIGAPVPNSQVRNGDTFGVLFLTLHPGGYDWRFVPEAGRSFTDSGTSSCH